MKQGKAALIPGIKKLKLLFATFDDKNLIRLSTIDIDPKRCSLRRFLRFAEEVSIILSVSIVSVVSIYWSWKCQLCPFVSKDLLICTRTAPILYKGKAALYSPN